jgi:hypothetical protein
MIRDTYSRVLIIVNPVGRAALPRRNVSHTGLIQARQPSPTRLHSKVLPAHDKDGRQGMVICLTSGDLYQRVHLRGRIEMEDSQIRAALDAHWAASDANDFELEHQIYREDAVLEYPQSGERIRGRRNIQASRFAQPNMKRFTVRRILGATDLWVTEFILTYDGKPSYTVSIMEFKDGKVARETQYFGDPFEPGPSRAQWVELMR